MIFKSQTPFECALKFITQLKNAATNQVQTEEKEYFYPHFPFNQQHQFTPIPLRRTTIFRTQQSKNNMHT